MQPNDKENNVSRYRERYRQFGYDQRTLGWSKGTQAVRFAAAIEGLEFASVLDVGCGFGDLFGFLQARGWKGRYLGIDLVPELIAEGVSRYGADGATFACAELGSERIQFEPELVIALGIFNHKLASGNWSFICDTLGAMARAAQEVVVADFLSISADKPRPDLYYSDPGQVLRESLKTSRRVEIRHAYMPFEFHVRIWKDDAFVPAAPVFKPFMRFINGIGQI